MFRFQVLLLHQSPQSVWSRRTLAGRKKCFYRLLISETRALSPILGQMDRALAAGIATSLLLVSSRATGILPTRYLPPEVELVIVTPDSQKNPLHNQVADAIEWADMVCAVGTPTKRATSSMVVQPGVAISVRGCGGLLGWPGLIDEACSALAA